jgi:hypothetical protein
LPRRTGRVVATFDEPAVTVRLDGHPLVADREGVDDRSRLVDGPDEDALLVDA